MIIESNSLRPKLRAWAEKQPEPIRLRAGLIDKNLRALAKRPDDEPPFEALRKNHAALVAMVSAQTSEE